METFLAVVIGFIIGAGSGALSAYLGWNKSGEPFEARKFISGLVTGIIAGVIVVAANTTAFQTAADDTALLISYIVMVLAIIGVDNVRTAITGSIRSRITNPNQVKLQEQQK